MDLERYVSDMIDDIRERGKEAVEEYSERFDDHTCEFRVKKEEFERAERIPSEDKEAIERAYERILEHHKMQEKDDELYEKEGSTYGLIYRPIERVGLYVPGGKPLPSSLLMTGIPARVAGVDDIVVTTPPDPDGKIDPHILYVARLLDIDEVYKLGGVQAVTSMAEGICMERVDKVYGPGNKYVNEAKKQSFGTVGIDSLAGPSELAIIADEEADPKMVRQDLLSQLEHGPDAECWLLTTSPSLSEKINEQDGLTIFERETVEECIKKANELAPEHLQVMVEGPERYLEQVKNAGAVYLGSYTPTPAADYFLGVNHVLPTGRSARYGSVLTVDDFMKKISVAKVSREEFERDVEVGERLASIEKMEEHRRSLEVRR